jgi:hypothetical protein
MKLVMEIFELAPHANIASRSNHDIAMPPTNNID